MFGRFPSFGRRESSSSTSTLVRDRRPHSVSAAPGRQKPHFMYHHFIFFVVKFLTLHVHHFTFFVVDFCLLPRMRHSIWLVRSFVRSLPAFARRNTQEKWENGLEQKVSRGSVFLESYLDTSVWFRVVGCYVVCFRCSPPSHLNPGLQSWKSLVKSLWVKSLSVRFRYLCLPRRVFSSLLSFVFPSPSFFFASVWFAAPCATSHRTWRMWTCFRGLGVSKPASVAKGVSSHWVFFQFSFQAVFTVQLQFCQCFMEERDFVVFACVFCFVFFLSCFRRFLVQASKGRES